jgi:uncharacterized protein
MNFIIIHGIYGNPEENWFPWLKKALESNGHEVIVPKFPTPIGQSLESWLRVLSQYENKINEETVLIGHSLGTPFILNYLEKTNKKIKAAYLVAGYHKLLDNKFYELNKDFVYKEFNWEKIKSSCWKFFVISSDNDQYIPLETAKDMADILGATFEVVHDGGHLNKEAGYDEFPLLFDSILLELD